MVSESQDLEQRLIISILMESIGYANKKRISLKHFIKKLKKLKELRYIMKIHFDFIKQTAICSINLEDYDSGSVSDELMERFHIQTRSGAHCAPLVHEHFGTTEQGMVRFSFGHETTMEEINRIIDAVKILAEE